MGDVGHLLRHLPRADEVSHSGTRGPSGESVLHRAVVERMMWAEASLVSPHERSLVACSTAVAPGRRWTALAPPLRAHAPWGALAFGARSPPCQPRPSATNVVARFARGSSGRRLGCSADADRLLFVEGLEDGGGVAFRFDLGPDPGDLAVRADQERGAGGAPVFLAVVLLLDPRAVGLGDLVVGVCEEGEREAELLGEGALARGTLRAHTPDVGAALDDRVVRVAELACLDRAAGRVVLRVEVEDGPAAGLVGEPVYRAGLVFKGDLRCRVADRGHVHPESVAGVSTTRIEPPTIVTDACSATRTLDRPRAAPRTSRSSWSG